METGYDISKPLETIISLLKEKIDMDLWMVTRVLGDDWIIIAACENNYGVCSGDVLYWNDSVCSRMVSSKGPNIVPNIEDEQRYSAAPIVKSLPISAYIGFPLTDENDELVGTLCAIDQNSKTAYLEEQLDIIKPFLALAQAVINQKDTIDRLQKTINFMDLQTDIDAVTGLANQNHFFELAIQNKQKYDKLGYPIAIIIVEIAGLSLKRNGDYVTYEDILRAITADLSSLLRESDILAKLDGSKFGILMANVENKYVSALVMKISKHLAPYKLSISIGADVCKEADMIEQSVERANSNRMI